MRHSLQLERPLDTGANRYGEGEDQWFPVAQVRAQIEPLSAQQVQQHEQTQGAVTHRITIRYRDGVNQTMRFVESSSGRIFNIAGVVNVEEMNRLLQVTCLEKT